MADEIQADGAARQPPKNSKEKILQVEEKFLSLALSMDCCQLTSIPLRSAVLKLKEVSALVAIRFS